MSGIDVLQQFVVFKTNIIVKVIVYDDLEDFDIPWQLWTYFFSSTE